MKKYQIIMASKSGVRGVIIDNMPNEWETILKKHRIYGIIIDLIYEHNIHRSRRRVEWCGENCIRLRHIMKQPFINTFKVKEAIFKDPKLTLTFLMDINYEINQLKNNQK